MVRPVSSASCCSDHFQSRRREPLEPPAIGGDHEAAHPEITRPADPIEPEPNAVDGELPGIMVDSKADVAVVGADVVDPVGDGSFVANRGLPPPLRRTFRPSEPGSRKSFRPRPIVLRASFVTRQAAAIPPYPAAFASAAVLNRRPRSSSEERTASYRMRRGDSSIIDTI